MSKYFNNANLETFSIRKKMEKMEGGTFKSAIQSLIDQVKGISVTQEFHEHFY